MGQSDELSPHVVLVGGGHAHLFVLEALIEGKLKAPGAVLVSPSERQYYSGMLPGVVAGHYNVDQCCIDLKALANRAGIAFMEQRAIGLNTDERLVELEGGECLPYDFVSLDVGSETDNRAFSGYEGCMFSVKPLDRFHAQWQAFTATAERRGGCHLAVVGAGAAGVELAMATNYALTKMGVSPRVSLIASENGLLSGFSDGVRCRVRAELERQNITLLTGRVSGEGTELSLSGGERLRVDAVILASGAMAPAWLAGSGLELDDSGFVLVDQCHRSRSHPQVFAVGDVAARPDSSLMRSGVHSVRAGPVLARNLASSLAFKSLSPFHPRGVVLYLLACGRKHGVASWGPLAARGDWVWRWKDRIDRRFIKRFDARCHSMNERG
ncbi:NADH dehydrogenase-like protein [Marinobacterium lacunae]|uniref:NADH dehydrogenase-like protein n=1 Tax=Marinobacterium lacunae TaxID=1232683 RepID=A0A081FWB7_9GAMM|nr:FAD-dependent oxidoreductase [Marinobacterium lacunae]KEA62822.1 NADH dehydrogenase-like protein [Marinobacterium lacunae]